MSKSKWLTFVLDFDAGLFVASVLLEARQERVSPHSGHNPLFEVPSLSFALLMLFFPSSVFLSIWPSYLSALHLPISCSCNEGHRHLHCPPLPHPHASAPNQITPATCTGHRALGPLPSRGLSSIARLALQSLSSPHPCTLSLKNGWGRGDTERLL